MFLAEFNQAPPDQLQDSVKQLRPYSCMGRKIISERPYSSTSVLLGYAEQLSHTWSWQEIQAALATHPKIGERQAKTAQCKRAKFFSPRTSWHFLR